MMRLVSAASGLMMRLFTRADAEAIGAILADVAKEEIMPRFYGTVSNQSKEKTSAFDIVTEADEAAERKVGDRLRQLFGSVALVGEEAAGRDPGLLTEISKADLAFIVDPIDGTRNFASGVPVFGVMVAATVCGEVALAAIHDPVCGNTCFAVRGEGAWRQGEAWPLTELKVASPVPVSSMQAVAGTNFLPDPLRRKVSINLSRIAMNFWLRCAAHEYRLAASGDCHLLMYNKLMPWDHAAGWLLHQEAGGYSAHFDGSPYLPSHTTGGLLCAPDRDSWLAAHEALFGVPSE